MDGRHVEEGLQRVDLREDPAVGDAGQAGLAADRFADHHRAAVTRRLLHGGDKLLEAHRVDDFKTAGLHAHVEGAHGPARRIDHDDAHVSEGVERVASLDDDVAGAQLVRHGRGLHGQGLPLVEGDGPGAVSGVENAQGAPDGLSRQVALLFDLLARDLLEAVSRRGAAAHEDIAVRLRVLHLGQGRNALPDEPLRFRRCESKQSLHR